MSYCRKDGKDVIIFATAEDHKEPSKVQLPEPEPSPGLILANGDINWNCPCLGGMATGPCGVEFREAFGCFHNSEAEPKGSDCYDAFREMHLCMAEYPALYDKQDDEEKDLGLDYLEDEDAMVDEHIARREARIKAEEEDKKITINASSLEASQSSYSQGGRSTEEGKTSLEPSRSSNPPT